jgi:hypothetical protein
MDMPDDTRPNAYLESELGMLPIRAEFADHPDIPHMLKMTLKVWIPLGRDGGSVDQLVWDLSRSFVAEAMEQAMERGDEEGFDLVLVTLEDKPLTLRVLDRPNVAQGG